MGSPNIAFIKYWGMRKGHARNLPNNSSVSMTLGGKGSRIFTVTSVIFSEKLKKDTFYIDGRKDEHPKGASEILERLRKMADAKEKALVVSYNSFPKSAGIASSASGSATLAFVASRALGLKLSRKRLSIVAREGSGSAARSVFGGIVKWRMGKLKNGSDSYAVQIAKPSHWPELIDLICVVSKLKKKVSTNEGHERTVNTSALYRARPAFAESNIKRLAYAVKRKDFHLLAELIMRDSNSMHATMFDSWPPIRYLTDESWNMIQVVQDVNRHHGENIAAYTFDAGPNAHIITTDKYKSLIKKLLVKHIKFLEIIESKAGGGPRPLGERSSLINAERLAPIAHPRLRF